MYITLLQQSWINTLRFSHFALLDLLSLIFPSWKTCAVKVFFVGGMVVGKWVWGQKQYHVNDGIVVSVNAVSVSVYMHISFTMHSEAYIFIHRQQKKLTWIYLSYFPIWIYTFLAFALSIPLFLSLFLVTFSSNLFFRASAFLIHIYHFLSKTL